MSLSCEHVDALYIQQGYSIYYAYPKRAAPVDVESPCELISVCALFSLFDKKCMVFLIQYGSQFKVEEKFESTKMPGLKRYLQDCGPSINNYNFVCRYRLTLWEVSNVP